MHGCLRFRVEGSRLPLHLVFIPCGSLLRAFIVTEFVQLCNLCSRAEDAFRGPRFDWARLHHLLIMESLGGRLKSEVVGLAVWGFFSGFRV